MGFKSSICLCASQGSNAQCSALCKLKSRIDVCFLRNRRSLRNGQRIAVSIPCRVKPVSSIQAAIRKNRPYLCKHLEMMYGIWKESDFHQGWTGISIKITGRSEGAGLFVTMVTSSPLPIRTVMICDN
jgi:hypothetical protein